MDNSSLLNYALRRRNFLMAMWLTLQQRWFVRSFNSSARVISWMVIALGMSLVTLTVVTLARNVVPILTTPGTLPYALLQLLVLVVSFNVYVNYFCATAFSRRLGKAPTDYLYRDPHDRDANARPIDYSDESEEEEEDEAEEEAEEVEKEDGDDVSVLLSGDGHSLYRTQPPLQPWQHRQGISADSVRPAAVPGGIQVVRVFGGEEGERGAPRPSPPMTADAHRRHVGDATLEDSGIGDPLSQRLVSSTATLSFNVENSVQEEREADGEAESESEKDSLKGRRATRWLSITWLVRSLRMCGRRLCPDKRLRHRRAGSRVCLDLHHCSGSLVGPCAPTTVASVSLLKELESMATTAERYGPRQRAFRVLDPPRRYCRHCRRLKAPREHHCAICNECVAKMDHHCPWINNCVGVENQRYFILFIAWLWLGTLLASAFVGYGVARQHRYTTQRRKLYTQWLRAPVKTALGQQLQALRMPYGPAGVLLTSYPTIMVLAVSVTMCVCMTVFIYFNRRLVLENTTVIESIFVDEKRQHANRSAGVLYRNPYDLGEWLNFLDMFTTAGDPVVRWATESLSDGQCAPQPVFTRVDAQRRHGWSAKLKAALCRAGVTAWLIGFPTCRPTHCDGVHYPTFESLASGDHCSLLRL